MKTIISVEIETMEFRFGGPATGNITIDVDNKGFPKSSWNDFVIVILGWWTTAILRIMLNESPIKN